MTCEEFCSRCLDVIAKHYDIPISTDSFMVAEYQLALGKLQKLSCEVGSFIFWFETQRLNQIVHFRAAVHNPDTKELYEAVVARAEQNGASLSQWLGVDKLSEEDEILLRLSSEHRFPWFANCTPVNN